MGGFERSSGIASSMIWNRCSEESMQKRAGVEQKAVWDLAVAAVENAIDVSSGRKGFPQAVTFLGNCAVKAGAGGAIINSAMASAAKTLMSAGYEKAATLTPLIGRGIVAFLLINSILPEIMTPSCENMPASTVRSRSQFIPAALF